MHRLFSRTWQIGAMLVLLTCIGAYFYFRFMGWSHPFAKLAGTDHYHVATLGDYVRYKEDPNRLDRGPAAVLNFDCERIRDDFVKLTQSIISPELSTSAETMVWRKGGALHLADAGVADNAAFAAWREKVVNLATIQHSPEASHYGTLLQALFTSVTIHGFNGAEEFSVATKRGSKLDACG